MGPIEGALRKLRIEVGESARYRLPIGGVEVDLGSRVGHPIDLRFGGEIRCTACGRVTRRSHGQGHCWPCFVGLARCDRCMTSPERCHFHLGTCREPAWGLEHCMRGHLVYLANASGLKVGITRASQVPTRWLDQGAVQALAVIEVASRRQSGAAERALATGTSDRTDWRRMLAAEPEPLDLPAERDALLPALEQAAAAAREAFDDGPVRVLTGASSWRVAYPVLEYPRRVRSIVLEKSPHVQGTLLGLKGQYLILDTGVLNVRRHAGYVVTLTA
jgi:hypothetical protein